MNQEFDRRDPDTEGREEHGNAPRIYEASDAHLKTGAPDLDLPDEQPSSTLVASPIDHQELYESAESPSLDRLPTGNAESEMSGEFDHFGDPQPHSAETLDHVAAGATTDQSEYWATEYGFHFSNFAEHEKPHDTPPAADGPAPDAGQPRQEMPPPVGRKDGFWREAKSLARDVLFAVIVAVLIVYFVVQPVKVEGTSMLSNLENGERLFVNKFTYSIDSIHRGDIVVFWFPNNPSQSFIKRVIALPGERIRARNGKVYVNDHEIQEPYLSADHTRTPITFDEVKVEKAHYFVMGDNRDASYDSRAWGTVPEKYIYGKAMFRYWPLEKFGRIEAPDEDVIDGR